MLNMKPAFLSFKDYEHEVLIFDDCGRLFKKTIWGVVGFILAHDL